MMGGAQLARWYSLSKGNQVLRGLCDQHVLCTLLTQGANGDCCHAAATAWLAADAVADVLIE